MEKILFKKSISKIKSKTTRDYFLDLFRYKNVFLKIILAITMIPMSMALCFVLRNYMLIYHNNLVVCNPGLGFSLLNSSPFWLIFTMQLLPSIVAFIIAIFIKDWYIYIFLFFLTAGGLSNVLDRFLVDVVNGESNYHTVVDYFYASTSIFNLPDVFAVTGSIGTSLFIFVKIILLLKEDKNENKNKPSY